MFRLIAVVLSVADICNTGVETRKTRQHFSAIPQRLFSQRLLRRQETADDNQNQENTSRNDCCNIPSPKSIVLIVIRRALCIDFINCHLDW